jgi:hypothetical protein
MIIIGHDDKIWYEIYICSISPLMMYISVWNGLRAEIKTKTKSLKYVSFLQLHYVSLDIPCMLPTPVLHPLHQSQPMVIFAFIILGLHFRLSIKLLIVMFLDSIS